MTTNALQPFKIRLSMPLSKRHMESLIHCYQPIIQPFAMSTYMTLVYQVIGDNEWSQRMTHAQLLEIMTLNMNEFVQARKILEAVGLVRTYREHQEGVSLLHQTLVYDVQLPLLIEQFSQNTLLSTLLYQKIGEVSYSQRLQQLSPSSLDNNCVEISASIGDVFKLPEQYIIDTAMAQTSTLLPQADEPIESEVMTFDFAKFTSYLLSEGVSQEGLTWDFRHVMLELHRGYSLDEVELSRIALLAKNELTQRIDVDEVKRIIAKRKTLSPSSVTVDSHERKQRAKANYPFLSEDDLEVIVLCEQYSPVEFVEQVKSSKGGFATSSERYYVKETWQKSRLSAPVINFLIYYLLVYQKQDNLYKANVERLASQWQSHKLDTPEAVFDFLRKEQAKEQPAKAQRSYATNKPRRQQPLPNWLNNSAEVTPSISDPDSQAALQRELDELFEERGT